MTRPGRPARVTAHGITSEPEPEFRPYTWRGIPGPVIGSRAELAARGESEDDGNEQA